MLSERERLIKRLNDDGIMVSIDYEPGGTYSASLLIATDKNRCCWESCWIEAGIVDLCAALQRGRNVLTRNALV